MRQEGCATVFNGSITRRVQIFGIGEILRKFDGMLSVGCENNFFFVASYRFALVFFSRFLTVKNKKFMIDENINCELRSLSIFKYPMLLVLEHREK